jgi:hypothetical protein
MLGNPGIPISTIGFVLSKNPVFKARLLQEKIGAKLLLHFLFLLFE